MRAGLLIACLVIAVAASEPLQAGVITLRSGNGSIGGSDSKVSMLVGPPNAAFGSAFTAAEFNAARTGPAASIINPHPLWKPTLTSDPSAEWISPKSSVPSDGNTVLYAIDFTITEASIASATLDFNFLVDNTLGDLNNEGLFINGVALTNTTLSSPSSWANFQVDQAFPQTDITSLVQSGLNTLYINAVDLGFESGLQFSATVNVTGDMVAVPEPSTLGIFAFTALSFVVGRRRRVVQWAVPSA